MNNSGYPFWMYGPVLSPPPPHLKSETFSKGNNLQLPKDFLITNPSSSITMGLCEILFRAKVLDQFPNLSNITKDKVNNKEFQKEEGKKKMERAGRKITKLIRTRCQKIKLAPGAQTLAV